jgi:peptidoglycan/xylan/chitin deacetylase (PgdA/CDA1 family)
MILFQLPKAPIIVKRVEHTHGRSAIVLLHDGLYRRVDPKQGNTVSALGEIIRYFKSEGYVFVTIPQLLADPDFAADYRWLFKVIKQPSAPKQR